LAVTSKRFERKLPVQAAVHAVSRHPSLPARERAPVRWYARSYSRRLPPASTALASARKVGRCFGWNKIKALIFTPFLPTPFSRLSIVFATRSGARSRAVIARGARARLSSSRKAVHDPGSPGCEFTTAIARGALNHARLTSELTTNRPEHLFASRNAVLTRNLSLSSNKTRTDSTDVVCDRKTRLSLCR
jgi:hypothetical protein